MKQNSFPCIPFRLPVLSHPVTPSLPLAALCLASLIFVTAACRSERSVTRSRQATPAAAETVEDVADAYWEALMRRFPTMATGLGDYRYNDRLDDASDGARRRWRSALTGLLERTRRASLGGREVLDRQLLAYTLQRTLDRMDVPDHLTPLNQMHAIHTSFPLILGSHPFRNGDDFSAYVARLRAFPRQVDQVIDHMRAGMRTGTVSPRIVIQAVVPQIETHVVANVSESSFFGPVELLTELPEAERLTLRYAIERAIADDVIPAYSRLLRFVEEEYLPRCRDSVGLWDTPDGAEHYAVLTRHHTTTALTPEEIHEIGLAEIERIRHEMDLVRDEVDFHGTLDDFIAAMRTDPRFRAESREEIIAAYDEILQRTFDQLPRLFGRIPRADCVMKEIEPFRAASAPVAYYGPSPEDGSRPGYFYINTYAPGERLTYTRESLTYHEAVPGHHFQLALDQENTSLLKFRRYAGYTAYVEGWALYAESLGDELGGYQDPYSRFGRLTFDAWRASRLVVDTGMHHFRWSREDAIRYMMQNTALAPIDIENEVDRYIAWPGQALAYKIGERVIQQLRRDAEVRAGGPESFDLRAFHDRLLSGGAMPLELLRERMSEEPTEPRSHEATKGEEGT